MPLSWFLCGCLFVFAVYCIYLLLKQKILNGVGFTINDKFDSLENTVTVYVTIRKSNFLSEEHYHWFAISTDQVLETSDDAPRLKKALIKELINQYSSYQKVKKIKPSIKERINRILNFLG